MSFSRLVFACLLAVLATTCSTSAAVTATSNFDRPVDVDFLCFDVAFNPMTYVPGVNQSPSLPLTAANCQLSDADNGPEGNGTTGNVNNHLLAVVTQFDRGELAVVDIANISGVSLVDNIPAVPGITFIPVGRLPTAVVADTWTPPLPAGSTTPPRTPMIWVANSQDNTITQLNALYIRYPLVLDGGPAPFTPFVRNISLAGSPRDLAVDTVTFNNVTFRLLYVALPDQGAIQVFDVTDPANPMPLDDGQTGDAGTVPVTAPASGDGGVGSTVDAGAATMLGHPVGLTLAPESDITNYPPGPGTTPFAHMLYVADDQNNWIHVMAPVLSTSGSPQLQEVDRYYVGVPTSSVVRVPQVRTALACGDAGATDPDHCAPDHYLYMISAVDGAVYVWDIERRTLVHANVLPGYVPVTDAGTDSGTDAGNDGGADAAADGESNDGSMETDAAPDVADVADVSDVANVADVPVNPDACLTNTDTGPPALREFDPTAPDLYRVYLPSPAAALTPIVTQDYFNYTNPISGPPVAYPCDTVPFVCPTNVGAGPGELHGVFLGVALRNGNFTVLDIDDYDYNCRIDNCNSAAVEENCFFRQARHYPRPLLSFTAAPRINSAPTLTTSSLLTPVDPLVVRSGVPAELSIPRIACYPQRSPLDEACSPAPTTDTSTTTTTTTTGLPVANGLFNFGVTLAPRTDSMVCGGQSDADVFTLRNEAWSITYQGVLPGLDLGGGQFQTSGGGNLLSVSVPGGNFCNRGTIGNGQEFITIVDDPAPQGLVGSYSATCNAIFGGGSTPRNRNFTVTTASQSLLQLTIPGGEPAALTPTLVATCFPQATHFQVRAATQWVVVGSRAGYLHSVVPGPNGLCVEDPTLQAAAERQTVNCLNYLSAHNGNACFYPAAEAPCPEGRVCMGNLVGDEFTSATSPVFANQYFCLQIYPGITVDGSMVSVANTPVDLQYAFAITSAYEPMVVSTGLLPSAAAFVSTVGRIYVVDNGSNGLIEYRIDPLTRSRVFD